MRILGIESSCDETAAAVVDDGPRIVSNIVRSQDAAHARFGGVVPEIASREHVARIAEVVTAALVDVPGGLAGIDGVAVTRGPGLIGSVLVGLQFAKGLALGRGIPFIGVHHLEGHLAAALLAESPPTYPHIALVVSGGHTQIYAVSEFGQYRGIGGTRDDAAGEAFDKAAKLLGLGYPGGVHIERAALGGDPKAVALPRSIASTQHLDVSFSGLKTAAAAHIQAHGGKLAGKDLADFCASLEEAIADVLTKKAVAAALRHGYPGIVLAGGVAANLRLRAMLDERCKKQGLWSFAPPKSLCTDNAAMIAAAGWVRLGRSERGDFAEPALSRWTLGEGGYDPRRESRAALRENKRKKRLAR